MTATTCPVFVFVSGIQPWSTLFHNELVEPLSVTSSATAVQPIVISPSSSIRATTFEFTDGSACPLVGLLSERLTLARQPPGEAALLVLPSHGGGVGPDSAERVVVGAVVVVGSVGAVVVCGGSGEAVPDRPKRANTATTTPATAAHALTAAQNPPREPSESLTFDHGPARLLATMCTRPQPWRTASPLASTPDNRPSGWSALRTRPVRADSVCGRVATRNRLEDGVRVATHRR